MRKLYLIGAIGIFLLILILALPEVGAVLSWYGLFGNTNPAIALLLVAMLGGLLGACLVLYFVMPKAGADDEESESPELPDSPPPSSEEKADDK